MNKYTTPIEAFLSLVLYMNAGGRGLTFPFRDRHRAESFQRMTGSIERRKIKTKRNHNEVEVRIYDSR